MYQKVINEIVLAIASIMAKEAIYNLWEMPGLLNRFSVLEFSDFRCSFLYV